MFVVGGVGAVARLIERRYPDVGLVEPVIMGILDSEGPFHLFDHGLGLLGIPRDEALISEMVRTFRSHRPVLEPWPGVRELLSGLKAARVGIGLVTDGYLDVQKAKWDALGLHDLFDAVVICSDIDGVAFPKPDRASFVKVAGMLADAMGAEPSPLVYVGDNPQKDFPAPDALGWKTVRVCRPGTWHSGEPDSVPSRRSAATTDELREILNEMLFA